MISLGATALAALNSSARGGQWLVELDFVSGTVYFTTAAVPIVYGGNTYAAYGSVLSIASVSESEDVSNDKYAISFWASQAMVAATLASVESYRGRLARLYWQVTDANAIPVDAPTHRFTGRMEPARIVHEPATKDRPARSRVEVSLSRSGVNRSRNYQGLRLTSAQQQSLFPGDRGLEYIPTLIEKPTQWLSKRFQEI
jgi:hypothetical protein